MEMRREECDVRHALVSERNENGRSRRGGEREIDCGVEVDFAEARQKVEAYLCTNFFPGRDAVTTTIYYDVIPHLAQQQTHLVSASCHEMKTCSTG